MLDNKALTDLLRERGFKVTPQRLAIYNALCNTKAHPNAEMLFNKLQPYYPTMSLATIYKTVDILHELGVINILNVGEDSFRYDANIDTHSHICCTECGRVDDVVYNADHLLDEVSKQTNVEVQSYQMYFYGICEECRLAKSKAN